MVSEQLTLKTFPPLRGILGSFRDVGVLQQHNKARGNEEGRTIKAAVEEEMLIVLLLT